jgi:hypothetical protein
VTRPELEARCRELKLLIFETDSDADLAGFIHEEQHGAWFRDNPEEIRDERGAE